MRSSTRFTATCSARSGPTCKRASPQRAGVNSSWPRASRPATGAEASTSPSGRSTHYTLLDLRHLCIAPDHAQILESVVYVLTHHKGADGGVNPAKTSAESDVCVSGMALNYASYFGAPPELLESVADLVLAQQMADGGFNCERDRFGARHSSLHSTISVLEGILEYVRRGYVYRAVELEQAAAEAREFILQHRLYKSDRTGQIINPRFLLLSYPSRWFYDILRALDYFRDAQAATIPGCRMHWMSSRQNVAGMAPGRCRPNIPARRISTWKPLASLAVGTPCAHCGCCSISSVMDEGADDDLRLHKRKIRTPVPDVKQQIKASAYAKKGFS